jgi:hypothetical protein
VLQKIYTYTITERHQMAASNMQTLVTGLLVVVVVVALVYMVDPTFFGLMGPSVQGFTTHMDTLNAMGKGRAPPATQAFEDMQEKKMEMEKQKEKAAEGFENMASVSNGEGPADFGTAEAPAGCYPRDQLTPSELLPKDKNSVWAEQNPMGPGSLKGKNFLSAGALLGVNTVGQSLRNANLQLRSEPPNPQMPVSIFNQSTIQPDVNRRPLEIN